MRWLRKRFGAALLTFVIGVGTTLSWRVIRPRFSRADEQANIMEVVYRYQVAEEASADGYTVFFLSLGTDADQSEEFMQRFKDMPSVRKFSEANKRGDGVWDRQTGKRGIILDVHVRIEWINNAEAKVGVGTYAWGWGQLGSVCSVVRENDRWVVKGCELTLIT